MTVQQFFKGLFMAVMGVIVTAFSTSPIDYALMIVTLISSVLIYSGKNLASVLNSESPAGKIDWINVLSGAIVAIGTGIADGIAMIILDGAIVWVMLGKVSLAVFLTYLGTTILTPPHSDVSNKKLKLLFK